MGRVELGSQFEMSSIQTPARTGINADPPPKTTNCLAKSS